MQTDIATPTRRGFLSFLRRPFWRLSLSSALAKFVIVGSIAFVINQAALLLLYDVLPILPAKDTGLNFGLFTHPDVRLLIASALAVEVAIVLKFYALENWTFAERERRGLFAWRFLQFNASCILSPIITVGTVNVMTPVLDISPYLSNSVGAVIGFAANWLLSAYVIWPHAREVTSETPTA